MVTGVLHLHDCPAAQNHNTDLAVVHHGLAALPVGRGGVVLGQAALDSLVQGVVNGVGTALGITGGNTGGKRVSSLGHRDVHPVGIAGSAAADVGIPSAHRPACGVVGVQGDRIGVVLDLLQRIKELIGGGGQFVDTGLLKDGLVVDNALHIAGGGDAVDRAVKGTVAGEVVLVLNVGNTAQRLKVVAQLGQGDGGGHHADVAPVIAGQAGGHIVGVVGHALILDGDVGVDGIELGDVLVKGAVLDQVGAVGQDLQAGIQVGAVGANSQLAVIEPFGFSSGRCRCRGRVGRAGACGRRSGAAAACQKCGGQCTRHTQSDQFFHNAFSSLRKRFSFWSFPKRKLNVTAFPCLCLANS